MSDLQKRGSYTPRRVREQRAYRYLAVGGAAGAVGVVGLVLAVVGAIGASLPIIALIVAAICVVLFRRTTGSR
jgi:putative flippase GtrA